MPGSRTATNLHGCSRPILQGWADIAILDAYEASRLPITEQVSALCDGDGRQVLSQRRAVPDEIEQPGRKVMPSASKWGQAAI